jgi:hypothetical protein
VVLHGEGQQLGPYTMIELRLMHEEKAAADPIPLAVQHLLDEYASVFEAPVGLPPRRQYDHHIPLIAGARPVSIRPYRVAPHLKTEIERQIAELLKLGVIVHSNSPFGSPVLLVKKEGNEWHLVVDYRHLNALTVKGKYPLPVIDELLDELCGAKFSRSLI